MNGLKKFYFQTKSKKIQTICKRYIPQVQCFLDGHRNNLFYLFNCTLDHLGLVNCHCVSKEISLLDVTHVLASKTNQLLEPYGFHYTEIQPPSRIKRQLSEFKNPDIARRKWEEYLREFKNRFLSDPLHLPEFYDFSFAGKFIWGNEDFSHRFFYLYWLSKHYDWEFIFNGRVICFKINLVKLDNFLKSSHFLLHKELIGDLDDFFKEHWLLASAYKELRSFGAVHPELFTNRMYCIEELQNQDYCLFEIPTSNPLSQCLDTPGVINVNKLLCHLALKTNSLSHARFNADIEKAVLGTLQN